MAGRFHSTKTLIEAEKLFDEGFGYRSVSRQLGVSKYTVRRWLDNYRHSRAIGLGRMTTHKKYAAEQKLAAVELFLSGVDKAEVIRRLEINNRALLSKWVAIYREQGAQGLEPRPKGRPKKDLITAKETDAMRIQRLEMEVEILKKYNALLAEEDYAQRIKRKSSRH